MRWFGRQHQEAERASSSQQSGAAPAGAPAAAGSRAGGSSAEGTTRAEGATRPQASQARPLAADEATQPRRRATRRGARGGLGWRTRDAGAAAVGTLGSGVMLLARLVMTAAALIALLIALAIVLRDIDANQSNTIVKGIHEGANFFAGAFTGLITFNGHPKRAITVDWGIALVVYLLVGALIASMIARIGRGGLRFERSHRVAPMP